MNPPQLAVYSIRLRFIRPAHGAGTARLLTLTRGSLQEQSNHLIEELRALVLRPVSALWEHVQLGVGYHLERNQRGIDRQRTVFATPGQQGLVRQSIQGGAPQFVI